MFSCCNLADSQLLSPLNVVERALSFTDSSGFLVAANVAEHFYTTK